MSKSILDILIAPNKCEVGKTYYLSGLWVDYGSLIPMGILHALGAKTSKIKYKGPKCLINTPVKYIGRDFKGRSFGGSRATFAFELPDKTMLYSQGDAKDLFTEKYKINICKQK